MTNPVRRALAVLAAIGGALAVFAGSPYLARHARIDVEALATAVAHEEDHVTAVELAGWIRDRKPGLRVIDVRSGPEFAAYHLPGAEHIPLQSIPTARFRTTETLVLYSAGGSHAAQAWVFLQALGYRQVYFLRGGVREWLDEVMSPAIAANASPADAAAFRRTASLSRYFGGVPRIGDAKPGRSIIPDWNEPSPQSSLQKASAAEIRRRGC